MSIPITHPVSVKVFKNDGSDYSALYAAKNWLRERGYVVGSTQRDAPIGVHHESECAGISKWRNLSQGERASLHGKLTGRPRSGDMTLTFVVDQDEAAVPVSRWGKDHWSTFAFVASWCERYGDGFEIHKKAAHMRTDADMHPEFGTYHLALIGDLGRKYPTRLKNGKLDNHDDWSCLEDAEAAGLIRREGTGTQPVLFMTDEGLEMAARLTAHKTKGGNFGDFEAAS